MLIAPKRPMPDFTQPCKVVDKRLTRNGVEYAVVNGHPNNVSVRWYHIRSIRVCHA
jgi:hypothetical protein